MIRYFESAFFTSSLPFSERFNHPRVILTALAASLFLFFNAPARAACEPQQNQASFYKDAGFKGQCVVKGFGDYPNSNAIGLPNDSISSLRVGPNTQVILCKDNDFRGDCIRVDSDVSFLNGPRVGNDQVSSLKIQPVGMNQCVPGPAQVSFFTNADFLGECVVKDIGDYASSGAIGLPNDSISSIRVGANVQALICKDNNFGGDCILMTNDVAFLNNNRVGNDQISSAKVQARGFSDCQPASNQVAFFVDADFLGACVVKDFGEYPNSNAIGLPNDSISSVRVGVGAQAVICKDNNFKKECILLRSNVNFLNGDRVGNDEISSAKVQTLGTRECEVGPNQVSFFEHADFLGPCVTKEIGDYPTSKAIGLDDKSISSVKIGGNVQACGCSGENFAVQCETFPATSNFLSRQNDFISSARVQKRGATCQAGTQPQKGINQLEVFNCHSEKRAIHLWMRDLTSGGAFMEKATLAAQFSNGSCPAGASPTVITLPNGHLMEFRAIDPGATACGGNNDPQDGGCIRSSFTKPFLGDSTGPSFIHTVN